MHYARRGILAFFFYLTLFIVVPSFALTVHPSAESRGLIVESKSVQDFALPALFFSGNFSYELVDGKAVLRVDKVTNSSGTATGPLRFSLWFTLTAYPSAGYSTASFDITPSLAGGASIGPVSATVPFTTPPNGCYYVSMVLEENVGANGVGSKPANSFATVNPTAATTYTLSAFTTANAAPPSKQVTVMVGQPEPTISFSASPSTIAAGQSSNLIWTTTNAMTNATTVTIDNGVGSQALSGSTTVHPTQTTTYTLTSTGAGGTMMSQAMVTVASVPTINFYVDTTATGTWTERDYATFFNRLHIPDFSFCGPAFTADPTTVTSGVASTPSWTTTGASLTSVTIVSGSSATLHWTTSGAQSVTIDQGIGLVTASGTLLVSPRQTTTYTLTATNADGSSSAAASVVVTAAVPPKHRAVRH